MKGKIVQIELTPAQKALLKKGADKETPAVRLNLQELETRTAPRLVAN
jgi:hypothetical protein